MSGHVDAITSITSQSTQPLIESLEDTSLRERVSDVFSRIVNFGKEHPYIAAAIAVGTVAIIILVSRSSRVTKIFSSRRNNQIPILEDPQINERNERKKHLLKKLERQKLAIKNSDKRLKELKSQFPLLDNEPNNTQNDLSSEDQ